MSLPRFTLSEIDAPTASILRSQAPRGITVVGDIPPLVIKAAPADADPSSFHINVELIIDVAKITQTAAAAWIASQIIRFGSNAKLHANNKPVAIDADQIAGHIEQQRTGK